MSTKFSKILMSTALAASLGAVAVAVPVGGSHAYAATNDQSAADKRKDKEERMADNKAFQEAQAAEFNRLFGTQEDSTTTQEQPANSPTTTESTTTTTKDGVTVVVPQGASLAEIAAQYGITVDELVAANNLLPAGTQLTIPQK
ncbi:LysM peptidoglycan-binding domain-containing protein [Paenibacillus sp. WLX1005]|uniref:LysM peptidoglycan-binding domain-containing protein n=1 Tax=Paenibacillus sp. WLX1005 TaxID=3243766 RepID=UPI003983E58B